MDRKSISEKCNFSPISIHCCVLVVIPLCSDHNNSLCTPSLHVRTYLSYEDPTQQRVTTQVSVVSAAVNGHHINLKPTVRHVNKPPFDQCCLPSLHTGLAARLAAKHVCEPPISSCFCDLVNMNGVLRVLKKDKN
jgi:hypothetical protein